MLVVPPIPPATPLAPVGISSSSPSTLLAPAQTGLSMSSAQLNVLEGSNATFTGTLTGPRRSALSRRVVVLQGLGRRGWHTLERARTNAKGRFQFTYAARQLGSELMRVRFNGDAFDLASHRRIGVFNVYRLAGASWYGGGGGLACGGTLTSSTIGVANKTLPCGTLVTLRYGSHTVRVPVVDRGPYVAGREFDLTEATKQALGFGDTGQVWSTR
jgi:rare lipoprotein A